MYSDRLHGYRALHVRLTKRPPPLSDCFASWKYSPQLFELVAPWAPFSSLLALCASLNFFEPAFIPAFRLPKNFPAAGANPPPTDKCGLLEDRPASSSCCSLRASSKSSSSCFCFAELVALNGTEDEAGGESGGEAERERLSGSS